MQTSANKTWIILGQNARFEMCKKTVKPKTLSSLKKQARSQESRVTIESLKSNKQTSKQDQLLRYSQTCKSGQHLTENDIENLLFILFSLYPLKR